MSEPTVGSSRRTPERRNILERGGGICKIMKVRNITELSRKKRRVVAIPGGVVFGRI